MKKLIIAILMVLALLLPTPTATAVDEPRGERFMFTASTDEDNSGRAESRALDLIYERDLFTGDHATPGLDATAGWVDGDRRQYRCGFAFLQYRDFIVGRVTVSKFQDPLDKTSGYIKINDRFMREPARNFNGTTNTSGRQTRECDAATEAYEPFSGTGEFPVVTFQHGPHPIDVRDFGDPLDVVVSNPSVKFDLVSTKTEGNTGITQVVILAYEDVNGELLPMASIYYELVPDVAKGLPVGGIVPGTQHHVSLHVGCGTECVHTHEDH